MTVGLEPVVRMLNRRDCPLGRSLVSHEKAADETPATGGHRRLSPIDVSHLDATGSGFITGNTKTRITARVILAFVWSVLDSNQWSANFIVVTAHWADHSLKFEKEFDEIPATGGHRILSPIDVSHLGVTGKRPGKTNIKEFHPQGVESFMWSVLDSNQWSACSIGATAHWADRLFRMRKPPMRLPPLAVIGGFPPSMFHILMPQVRGSLRAIQKPGSPQG